MTAIAINITTINTDPVAHPTQYYYYLLLTLRGGPPGLGMITTLVVTDYIYKMDYSNIL